MSGKTNKQIKGGKDRLKDWRYGSVVENLLTMCVPFDSIPSNIHGEGGHACKKVLPV